MKIKRSLAIAAAPISEDGVTIPRSPASGDPRWKQHEIMNWTYEWTGPWGYVVKRVTNSTAIRPGFLLTRKAVDDLIREGWTVTVRSKV